MRNLMDSVQNCNKKELIKVLQLLHETNLSLANENKKLKEQIEEDVSEHLTSAIIVAKDTLEDVILELETHL